MLAKYSRTLPREHRNSPWTHEMEQPSSWKIQSVLATCVVILIWLAL